LDDQRGGGRTTCSRTKDQEDAFRVVADDEETKNEKTCSNNLA